jgi:hypothetical protein
MASHLPSLQKNPANFRRSAIVIAAVGAAKIVKWCQGLSDTHELHYGGQWILCNGLPVQAITLSSN